MELFNDLKISMVLIVCGAAIILGNIAKAELYFGTPVNLGPNINTFSADGGTVISPDGCTMYFSSDRPESLGGYDIYEATRESLNDEWGPAVPLAGPVNTTDYEFVTSISADGLSLYITSDRPGGYGNTDIGVTTRATTSSPWSTPINLGSTVNRSSYDYHPFISSDGLSLYFCSNRSGGYGGYDLWVTTRATTSSPWGTPINLGSTINSSSNDSYPNISTDGLSLFFVSTRPNGYGHEDIYVTTRVSISDQWDIPVNIGPQVNTPAEDLSPYISTDDSILYFTSRGHRGYGSADAFEAPIFYVPTCGDLNHPYPLGDFNMDCHVDTDDLLIFIMDYWLECTAPECDEVL